jgi:transcriptional regulator with XRE-family HTH domain
MTEQVAHIGGAPDLARRVEENVREVVRMLMAAKRVDAAELAAVIGVSRASTYERLKGRRPFGIGELAAMAEHFDVPASVFLAGSDGLLRPAASPREGSGSIKTLRPYASRSDVKTTLRGRPPSAPRLRAVAA